MSDIPTRAVSHPQSELRLQMAWAVDESRADALCDRYILQKRETTKGVVEVITIPFPLAEAATFTPDNHHIWGEPNVGIISKSDAPLDLSELRPAYPDDIQELRDMSQSR